jgi:hypothetical protein
MGSVAGGLLKPFNAFKKATTHRQNAGPESGLQREGFARDQPPQLGVAHRLVSAHLGTLIEAHIDARYQQERDAACRARSLPPQATRKPVDALVSNGVGRVSQQCHLSLPEAFYVKDRLQGPQRG